MIAIPSFIASFRAKTYATFAIWRRPRILRLISYSDETRALAVVEQVLSQRLVIQSAEHAQNVRSIAEEIFAKLQEPPSSSLDERLQALGDGVATQAFWFHGQLAGITTMWEFRIRLFVQKIGMSSYVPRERRTNRNRANRSIQQKRLSEIIKELDQVTGGRLKLKLSQLSDLRDTIVHCNSQGMRAYARIALGRDALAGVRGDVIVFTPHNNEMINLSNVADGENPEEHELFSWFLEVFNSVLPKKAFKAFENSIIALNKLTEFAALSEGGREHIFKRLMLEGIFPLPDEIELYRTIFEAMPGNQNRDLTQFFTDLRAYFKLSQ